MIDTDTRQLRRRENGAYTSGGIRKTGGRKTPCDHCAVNDRCGLQERTACALFIPALPFQDETGLDQPSNTVRVGKAWTERLIPDQVIALYNAKTKVVFGFSKVVSTHAGPIDQMLSEHAHNNHLMLTADPATAAATLHQWQLRNYGPRIIGEHTRITAIYLQRIADGAVNAFLADHETQRASDASQG